MIEKVLVLDDVDPVVFYGACNANMRMMKSLYPKLRILARDNVVKVMGADEDLRAFEGLFNKMIDHCVRYNALEEEDIVMLLNGTKTKEESAEHVIVYSTMGKPIKARTENQVRLVQACEHNDMVFAVGPAGTGKTYLAVALAVRAFKAHEIQRIILTRPAVEAGEKLGFLPGDLQNKVDPYLRPLYDALFEMMGAENYQRNLEKGFIEVAPLAYMRGRTLDDSFIILDEAQNTTPEQMKMFLTRLGFNSKMVITGDVTQIDLPDAKRSGLVEAVKVLKNVDGIAINRFSEKDVVRHKLVQDIVKAYEKYNTEFQRKTDNKTDKRK